MTISVSAKAIFALILLLILSHTSFAQSNEDLYDRETDRILKQYEQGKINRTTSFRETLAATKTYRPNDRLTQAFFQSLLEYSEQQDKKLITQKKFEELLTARAERYREASIEMVEARKQAQRQSDQDNARRRQDQIDAYNAAMAEQQNTAATAQMLQGIGRAFNSSFGQSITPPMQICSYYGNTRYCQ